MNFLYDFCVLRINAIHFFRTYTKISEFHMYDFSSPEIHMYKFVHIVVRPKVISFDVSFLVVTFGSPETFQITRARQHRSDLRLTGLNRRETGVSQFGYILGTMIPRLLVCHNAAFPGLFHAIWSISGHDCVSETIRSLLPALQIIELGATGAKSTFRR